jgi:hypothetical protein
MIHEIEEKLKKLGIPNDKPAWKIIENANFSNLPTGSDVKPALIKLMKSFYDYGRDNDWKWVTSSKANLLDGGLVRGESPAQAACGTFNQNFRWLAEKVLDITGWTQGEENSHFLTKSDIESIDKSWVGNVRTKDRELSLLKCFKFSKHYWVVHCGTNYDVCYNNNFNNSNDIIWSRLTSPDDKIAQAKGLTKPGQLFKLVKLISEGDYLKEVDHAAPNGWPTFIISKEAEL